MDQILSQARNYLICPVCNRQYEIGEIKLRGFIDNTYIFQAYCSKDHEPLIVTYLASLHRLEKPISAYFHTLSGEVITKQIVEQANKTFDEFDGNFSNVFRSTNQKPKT